MSNFYKKENVNEGLSFEVGKPSRGIGALTPDAAQQLGPKAVELQKKKAAEVDLPNKSGVKLANSYKPKGKIVKEAHYNPTTGKIQAEKPSEEEINTLAKKAAASGPKKRKPVGSVRKNSATFKPSSPEQAKADMKSWNDYWSGSETIDVGADAGSTISDFVHSKSKTFKGDSKKQRIKRALGAYYGASKESEQKFHNKIDKLVHKTFGKRPEEKKMKEEIENSYECVIEALVEYGFAEDDETANDMIIGLSEGFIGMIFEEYLEEKARGTRPKTTAHAYDMDETLFGHDH